MSKAGGGSQGTEQQFGQGSPASGAFYRAPIEFSVPHVPPPLNVWSRAHWTARARWAKDWHWIIRQGAPKGALPHFTVPVIVTMTFYMKADCDALAKFPLDGCKGILFPDDSPKWVTELRLRSRKGDPRTVIRVEAASQSGLVPEEVSGE